jgi:predicted metallopeptidase
MRPLFSRIAIAGGLLLALASFASAAPGPVDGQWLLERGRKPGMISLTIRRSDGPHHQMSSTDDFPVAAVRGLDWKQADSTAGGSVRFQIVRDAGVFACEGWFRAGKGSGHFRFTPDSSFVAEIGRHGYRNLSSEQYFALAVHDVSRALLRDYAQLGYGRIPFDELIAMRIHGASPAYIRELAALGYSRIPAEDLVAMRIHGVSPAEIRKYSSLGYPRFDLKMLVDMRIHGVSPGFVQELRAEGYQRVPAEELVEMRIHGVSTDFIRRLKKRGYASLSVRELIDLKIHGVAR